MFFIAPITEAMAIEHRRQKYEAQISAFRSKLELESATIEAKKSVKQSNCQNCGAPHEHNASTCSYCLSPVN